MFYNYLAYFICSTSHLNTVWIDYLFIYQHPSGSNIMEKLKQKKLLNNFLLSKNEQDTSHKWNM